MFSVDVQGYCYFKGRTGDIIRTNGAQVSPREVEGVLSDVTGGRTAIVIGVPDPARGQAVTAVLVGSDPVDQAALTAALRDRLSAYKVPRRFLTMEESELPLLSSGKIDLKKLAEIASER
jgi:acyl-CoA synthetase (AMP-forming)/AMP-acid ligase II